jgi:hypothetical protein
LPRAGAGAERAALVRQVERLLDRQQEVGRTLDLVDHRRLGDVGHEPVRVGPGDAASSLLVEVVVVGHEPGALELTREGALAGLARPEDRAGATAGQHIANLGLDVAGDQLHTTLQAIEWPG